VETGAATATAGGADDGDAVAGRQRQFQRRRGPPGRRLGDVD
jgi:hypothetical protein